VLLFSVLDLAKEAPASTVPFGQADRVCVAVAEGGASEPGVGPLGGWGSSFPSSSQSSMTENVAMAEAGQASAAASSKAVGPHSAGWGLAQMGASGSVPSVASGAQWGASGVGAGLQLPRASTVMAMEMGLHLDWSTLSPSCTATSCSLSCRIRFLLQLLRRVRCIYRCPYAGIDENGPKGKKGSQCPTKAAESSSERTCMAPPKWFLSLSGYLTASPARCLAANTQET
jgi:hypothetical protein